MNGSVSPAQRELLMHAAKLAAGRAYCPYSRFPVGAAVLAEDGSVHSGCNVENASSGLTICAERNAVFAAVTAGHRTLKAVAIYTPTATPTAPCGACRQVLYEFNECLLVISGCVGTQVLELGLQELLPLAFGPRDLSLPN